MILVRSLSKDDPFRQLNVIGVAPVVSRKLAVRHVIADPAAVAGPVFVIGSYGNEVRNVDLADKVDGLLSRPGT